MTEVYYGDLSHIPAADLEHIDEISRKHIVSIKMEPGDTLLIDNYRCARRSLLPLAVLERRCAGRILASRACSAQGVFSCFFLLPVCRVSSCNANWGVSGCAATAKPLVQRSARPA